MLAYARSPPPYPTDASYRDGGYAAGSSSKFGRSESYMGFSRESYIAGESESTWGSLGGQQQTEAQTFDEIECLWESKW